VGSRTALDLFPLEGKNELLFGEPWYSSLVFSRHIVSHGATGHFLGKGLGAEQARGGPWGLLPDWYIKSVNMSL